MTVESSPLPNNPTPPMPIQPDMSGYQTGPGSTGNPVLNEISAAHANLSPQAQQAIEGAHGMLGISPSHSDPALAASAAPSSEVAVPGVSGPRGPLPILSPEIPAPAHPMGGSTGGTPMADGGGSGVDPALLAAHPSDSATPQSLAAPSPLVQERSRLTAPPLPGSDPNARTSADTGRTGIGQIHNPWLRGLATAGDVIASGVFPRFGQFIPGTSGYHNNLVAGNERAIANEEGSAKNAADVAHTGAETGLEGAQAEEAKARAESLANPPKAGLQVVGDGLYDAANKTWIKEPTDKDADKVTEVDPEYGKSLHIVPTKDGKYLVPSAAIGELLKPKTPVEGETPLTNVDQLNKAMETRYQVLHPGGALPPQFTLPANATQKDYDRLDKALAGTESALGTKAQRDAAEAARDQARALLAENKTDKSDTTLKGEVLKDYAPAQDSAERLNVMTKNRDEAVKNHDQQAMLSLLANHLGMTMGLAKGARINQAIIKEAEQSRPWLQGMGAKFDKDGILTGVTLTPPQMDQMVELGRERFAEDVAKARNSSQYRGAKDDGPKRTMGESTVDHYLRLNGNDPAKAKAAAVKDGWSVE